MSTGRKQRKKCSALKRSCAHHNTDLWGDTAPQDNWQPATTWTQGLAWLVTHTYDYYLYTGDIGFLRENFGPIKNAARFYFDFLTPYKGWMVTNPTTSPENTFIAPDGKSKYSVTLGSTIDNSLIRILFQIAHLRRKRWSARRMQISLPRLTTFSRSCYLCGRTALEASWSGSRITTKLSPVCRTYPS